MHIKFENHQLNTLRSTWLEWEPAADCRTFMFQIFLSLPWCITEPQSWGVGVCKCKHCLSLMGDPSPFSFILILPRVTQGMHRCVISPYPGIILWDNKAGGTNQVLNNEPWFYWWGNDYLVQVHRARNKTHHCDCWISHFPSSFCMWPRLGLPVPFNMNLRKRITMKRKSNQKQNAGFGLTHKFHHIGIKLRTFFWASANDSSSSEALLNKRLHGLSFKEKNVKRNLPDENGLQMWTLLFQMCGSMGWGNWGSDCSHVCKMKWKNISQPQGKVGQREEKWNERNRIQVKLFNVGSC